MTICGVVAEYNPFHNGHAWQLRRARELSGCDYVIVCMGGGVSQRGEVMLLDKWTRARMALMHGADLVVELPALFAVRPAEAFARGGVLTLVGLCADALSFGCETDDESLLSSLAWALDEESEALSAETKRGLADGLSHARARGEALERLNGLPEGFMNRPNVTLALEYMRTLRHVGRSVAVYPIQRIGGYRDAAIGEFSGASAIRAALEAEGLGPVRMAVPAGVFDLLAGRMANGCFARQDRLDSALLYRLRVARPEELAGLCDVSEGLEGLFVHSAPLAASREDLLERVRCRRYTRARLSRFCACALLSLTRSDALAHPVPEYARVLGFRREALPLLRYLKAHATLPLASDPVALRNDSLFRFDRAATDLQALAMESPAFRAAGQDFTRQIVIVDA